MPGAEHRTEGHNTESDSPKMDDGVLEAMLAELDQEAFEAEREVPEQIVEPPSHEPERPEDAPEDAPSGRGSGRGDRATRSGSQKEKRPAGRSYKFETSPYSSSQEPLLKVLSTS